MRNIAMVVAVTLVMPFSMLAESAERAQLIDIATLSPTITIDCVYATTRNFTGMQIYFKAACYLLKPVAKQLGKVHEELEKKGYGLHIWDGYRPPAAQKRLWEVCPDERFVAPPSMGGPHTRGIAVDLTIYCLADGKLLDMGTKHDDFTERATYSCPDISEEAKRNRTMLREIMIKYGFKPYENEWWHFNFQGWHKYPILDIDFEEL